MRTEFTQKVLLLTNIHKKSLLVSSHIMNKQKSCTEKSMVVMVLVSTMSFILCLSVCLSVCLFFISQVILWQFCVQVNLENFHPILEQKAEVVTNLERQNSLISSCHDGLSSSIESIASLGHLGM